MAKRLLAKLGKKISDAQARRDRFEIDAVERLLKALKVPGKPRRPRKRAIRKPAPPTRERNG